MCLSVCVCGEYCNINLSTQQYIKKIEFTFFHIINHVAIMRKIRQKYIQTTYDYREDLHKIKLI